MTQAPSRSSPLFSVLFVGLSLGLAALLWVHVVLPARADLTRQMERRDHLLETSREMERERLRLERLTDALENDPAVIERALRSEGYQRLKDRILPDDGNAAAGLTQSVSTTQPR